MRIGTKGQVTIPIEIREELGLLPNSEIEIEIDGDAARIRKAVSDKENRGEELVRRLRGSATVKITTAEVMALTRQSEGIDS